MECPEELGWKDFHDKDMKICKIFEKCSETNEYNYFLFLSFCKGDFYYWTYLLVVLILIGICFYFLSSTGGDYLSEIFGLISKKLNCSQNLAGLTLLAFGDEAADIITSIVSGDEDDGIKLALGALFGASSIVLGIIMSIIIFIGVKTPVESKNFIRDLSTYLLALILIYAVGLTNITDKAFNFPISIILFSLYWIYVGICIVMDKCGNKDSEVDDDLNGTDFAIRNLLIDNENPIGLNDTDINDGTPTTEDQNKLELQEAIGDENDDGKKKLIETKSNQSFDLSYYLERSYINQLVKKKTMENNGDTIKVPEKKKFVRFNRYYYSLYVAFMTKGGQVEWKDKSLCGKIFYWLVDFPLDLVRYCTIPPFDNSRWKRKCFIVMPICILFLVSFGLFKYESYKNNFWLYVGLYSGAVVLSIIFYFTTYRANMPNCQSLLLFFAMVMSIFWIYLVIEIVINLLTSLSILLKPEVDKTYFTMTILAFGNAIPDLFVGKSLAEKHLPEMAISGSIGSPILSLFFGFGLSMVKKHITTPKSKIKKEDFLFDLTDENYKIILIPMVGVTCQVIHLLLTGCISKFNLHKIPTSIIGFIIFGCYLAFLTVYVFKK